MSLPNRPHGIRAATTALAAVIAFVGLAASALLPACAAPRAIDMPALTSAPQAPRDWFDSHSGHPRAILLLSPA